MQRRMHRNIRKLTAGILCAVMMVGCGAAGMDQASEEPLAPDLAQETEVGGVDGESSVEEVPEKPRLVEEDEEDMTISRALMKANQVQNEGDARIFAEGEDFVRDKKGYTILVYMTGSDLEGNYGYGSRDIKEMEESGIDLENNNLLVYTGGSRMWKSDIPSGRNNVLDMSLPTGERVVAATEKTSDMGAPETLSEFLSYGVQRYPANHYALVFWDHGGGSVHGYGNDVLYGGDSLLLTEMQTAMNNSPFGPGGSLKLDWVGFDACLMSTAENADVWKQYTNYMIASEETEPGDGWSYAFLNAVSGDASPETIGRAIVDAYEEYYAAKRTPLNDPDITLTVLNLRKMDNLVGAIDALSQKMQKDVGDERFVDLVRARSATKTFGVRGSRDEAYDLLDIRDLAANMSDWYPTESAQVESALKEVLMYSTQEVDGACGLSLYFPGENRELYEAVREEGNNDMYISDTFRAFADSYTEKWLTASDIDWTLADIVDAGDELTLQLTGEQAANLDNASYTVLLSTNDGHYRRGICRVTVEPDENHVLHIPKDPDLIVAATDQDGVYPPCAFVQTDSRDGELSFESMSLIFRIGLFIGSSDYVIASVGAAGDELTVKGFCYDDTTVGGSGKNTVDLTDYKTMCENYYVALYPTMDEAGNMLPYYEWETRKGGASGFFVPLDEGLRFEYRKASLLDEDSVVQVLVRDINGSDHGSNIHDLCEGVNGQKDERTMTTEKGTLTFEITEGEAVLTKYVGEDKILNIPTEVDGFPVTRIDGGLLGDKIREITVPEGVRKLDHYAFSPCPRLRKLTLPGSIETVCENAIDSCDELEEILMTGESSAISVKDGVLFSADGKTLIKYPNGRGRFYEIPEGTEAIGYAAFKDSDLVEVIFPETLREIDNLAFENCDKLRYLDLPDSLERIGAGAFSVDHSFESKTDEEESPVLDTVSFGPRVRSVGKEAFSQRKIVSFEVSPDNEAFSAVNGMLASKAGDVLILCPMEIGGSVTVPEGVIGLAEGVFADLSAESAFVLPDSLTRMSLSAFPSNRDENYNTVYDFTIYCTKGSAVETFAAKNKLTYKVLESGDLELESYTLTTLPGLNGIYTFRLYDDYAMFVRYRGTDAYISVPEFVNGLPVTEIGDGSCVVENSYHWNVEYEDDAVRIDNLGQYPQNHTRGIKLPDSVQAINAYAFANIWLTMDTLVLPDALAELDPTAFGSRRESAMNVGAFCISEDNPNYKTVDGVLFNKDGSRLVRFPSKPKTDMAALTVERVDGTPYYTYRVPDGVRDIGTAAFCGVMDYEKDFELRVVLPTSVKNIGENAFRGAQVADIVLNEGLETISNGAFKGMKNESTSLILPSTVETIGKEAFADNYRENKVTGDRVYGFNVIELPDSLEELGGRAFQSYSGNHLICDELVIGRKLDEISEEAFYNSNVRKFSVAHGNDSYKSVEGCLISEDGSCLLAVPDALEGEFTVPAGVTEIGHYAFYDCGGITDVHISGEVTRISSRAFFVGYGNTAPPVIHGEEGSEAERFARAVGMEWEEE